MHAEVWFDTRSLLLYSIAGRRKSHFPSWWQWMCYMVDGGVMQATDMNVGLVVPGMMRGER
jgi:hypothetical protein